MSFRSFPTNLVPGAVVDPKSGSPTQTFYKFLLALFNSTGGGDGIVPQVSTGLTATGVTSSGNATQSTALLLAADWNQVTGAPTAANPSPPPTTFFSGVALPSLQPGNDITVWNDTANTLLVYPFSDAGIGSGAVNSPYSLPAGDLAYFQCWSSTLVIPLIKVNPLTL